MRTLLSACLSLALALIALVPLAAPAAAEGPNAVMVLPNAAGVDGCAQQVLNRNDDGSTGRIELPFTLNFFGTSYTGLYVNNNGNVTFRGPMSTYTPFPIVTTGVPLIAPFFGDVDTRGLGSEVVRYTMGYTTFGGRNAFCVNWVNVGYYSSHYDKLNSFQLVLVERGDVGAGDFDIIMNFDKILWETGDASGGSGGLGGSPARMGFSNGSTAAFEQPGSGVVGRLLNSNTTTGLIYNSRNSTQPGRYIFPVRNGVAPTGATVTGNVYANVADAAHAVAGAFVQLCGGGLCNLTSTGPAGQYTFTGVAPGSYTIGANPPASSPLEPGTIGPIAVGTTNVTAPAIVLSGPQGLPNGTTITNRYVNPQGIPVVYWNEPLTLTRTGCPGGTASYVLSQNGSTLRSGTMAEDPAGTYAAAIAPLYPLHGYAHVAITIGCADGTSTTIAFDIYIDPSGTVRTTSGDPIAGATVALYRSDSASGPFSVVADGSAIMSIANRRNPDTTDGAGRFGWDVIAGYYRVRASAEGCVSPQDASVGYVESAVLQIPPAVTDLDLRLSCPDRAHPPVAHANGPYQANEGGSVVLTGTATDQDGGTLTYAWDLDGNGSFETPGASVTFSALLVDGPARRTVTLRVTDQTGLTGEDPATVDVRNVAPQVTATATPASAYWGVAISFNATATDPAAADTLTFSWAFGDGGTATHATGAGIHNDVASHTYATPGIYAANVVVTDDDGDASAPYPLSIQITRRPTATACANASTVFGSPTTLSATVTDTSAAATVANAAVTYAVDGTPVAGSASPALAMPGTHTVTATFAGDTRYDSSSATCTLTVTNATGLVTTGLIRVEGKGRGGFNAQYDATLGLKGELEFQNATIDLHAHTITALGVSADRKTAWFAATGTNGEKVVVYVEDNGEPGTADVAKIWVDGVPQNGEGQLFGGNVQIH